MQTAAAATTEAKRCARLSMPVRPVSQSLSAVSVSAQPFCRPSSCFVPERASAYQYYSAQPLHNIISSIQQQHQQLRKQEEAVVMCAGRA